MQPIMIFRMSEFSRGEYSGVIFGGGNSGVRFRETLTL
jgi:hypothetical protein